MDEGPILNKIGSGIGKAVGGLAKGVGAVAGGIAGIGSAVKKGYQAGKSTVGGAGDDPGAATPPAAGTSGAATPPASGAATSPAGSAGAATSPAGSAGAATPPAGSAGAATPPASGAATSPAGGAGGAGAAKTDPAAEASVKAIQQQVDKLSPDAKQKLLTKLQTSIEQGGQSAKENPTAQPAATSAPGAATPDATTPAATDATATATPTPTPTPDATATTQPTVGKTAAPANKAAADTFEKAKGDIRKVQSGTKPLPDQMAQGVQADIAKMAKGDKESGVAAAQKIMGFAGKGMDVAALQQAWSANAKAGERFLSQSVYRSITNMLGEYGLAWKDLGISVRLVESVSEGVFIKYTNRDLSETLSTKISEHKRRIFETQLSQGTASVFVK